MSTERDVANDGGVIVAIPAIPGVAYTIQQSNNLSEWLDYSFFAGDDSTFVVPVPGLGGGTPSTGEPTFFRVRIEGDQ